MDSPTPDLQRFIKRVRLVRSIRYLCLLTFAGSILATACALFDLFEVYDFSVLAIAALIAFCSLGGILYGLLQKVPQDALAKSIDRRSDLQDRLSSAMTVQSSAFLEELKADAATRLKKVSERTVYPIRFARAQFGMMFSIVLPFAVLFVSTHHLLLSPDARAEREQVKTQAVTVQHVLKTLSQSPEAAAKQAELIKELQRLQKDLEKGKLNSEAAKAKADKISQEADRMMREENKETRQSLDSAQSALDREKQERQLDKATGSEKTGSQLSGKESEDKLRQLAAKANPEKMAELAKKMAELEKKLADPKLSQAERDALQKEMNQMQKEMQQLQLSKEAQETLQKLMDNPEYKKLMEMMQKLQQNSEQMDAGQGQQLTKEQLEEMRKEMEELAKELKDPAEMEKYIKAMEQAIKDAEAAGNMQMAAAMMAMMGMHMGGAPDTTPGPPNGAPLNMSKDEAPGKGKTHEIGIQAEQKPNGEPSPYIEQRGMAKLTGPSSIPMLRDVSASRHKAEEAINKQRIPKEQQERVKKYFESLEGK